MINKTFSVIDYVVFIVLLIVSASIGVYFAWRDRKKSHNDYLTGGGKLSMFPVCLSLISSFISSNTFLGVPAEVYLFGTQYSLHIFIIAVFLAANVFMPVYYKLKLTSVHKYLLRRFGLNSVRISGSIGFILCTLPYLGVVLYGPALALSAVTPLSQQSSIILVGFICTFYTSIGGIKAVIWTDVIQTFLMVTGLLMVVIVGCVDIGFIEPFKIAYNHNRLQFFNTEFNIYRGDTFWAVVFGSLVGWSGTYCVKQTQVQRYCCMGSETKAKKTLYWNIPGVFLLSFLAIWCGIILFAKYHNCDPVALKLISKYDQLMPYFVMESLSKYPGLAGLFVSSVFSGSLSTLSSGFNALATVTWDDFVKRAYRKTTPKKQLYITKLIATIYGLLAIAIAFIVGRLGTVLQASYSMSGSITGPLLSMFCLGLFCPFSNAFGAIGGFIAGIGTCLFITFGTLVYPKPKGFQLPVSVDGCSRETFIEVTSEVWTAAANRKYTVDYWPEGILKIFHVNYIIISFVGFAITMIVGIILSLIFQYLCQRNKTISDMISKKDDTLLSPIVSQLCPYCIGSSDKQHRSEHFSENGVSLLRANFSKIKEFNDPNKPVIVDQIKKFNNNNDDMEANPLMRSEPNHRISNLTDVSL